MCTVATHSQTQSQQRAPDSPSDLIERVLPTGALPIWLVEDLPSDQELAGALKAIQLIRPDLAIQLEARWEALDEAYDREGLDCLSIAMIRLAQQLQEARKDTL